MISVVMATYNGDKYIEKQLDSIRKQTKNPDEVLILDDCSTDNTVSLITKYIGDYNLKSWKLIENKENLGYSKSFTKVLNAAKGNIIFLCDQDDYWFPEKIEQMSNFMNNSKIELLASNLNIKYESENAPRVKMAHFQTSLELVYINKWNNWVLPLRPGCSMCIKSSLLKDYNVLWSDVVAHDRVLWNLAMLRKTAFIYNRPTGIFRRHGSNASSKICDNKSYRISSIAHEKDYMNYVLGKLDFEPYLVMHSMIKKQIDLWEKRSRYIEKGNLFGIISLFSKIKLYPRFRFWLTDCYYCIK